MTNELCALIIDDQVSNIDVLAMLLKQEGVASVSVTSVRGVFEALDQTPGVGLVFLDLEMPNGDYHETLAKLKADPRLSGVPIIAYTVHTSEIDQARQAGFDGFIGKPLHATEFSGQLQRILNGERVWSY